MDISFALICGGNFGKPRRQRQRECRQTKDLMRKTIFLHMYYKYLYIFLPSSANNNVKWPNSENFEQLGPRRLIIFFVSFGKRTLSLNLLPELVFKVTDTLNMSKLLRDSWTEYKFMFYWTLPSASPSQLLKVPSIPQHNLWSCPLSPM